MHTCIIIHVYLFYLCKCISLICLLVHYLLFFGVKKKLLVLVILLTNWGVGVGGWGVGGGGGGVGRRMCCSTYIRVNISWLLILQSLH